MLPKLFKLRIPASTETFSGFYQQLASELTHGVFAKHFSRMNMLNLGIGTIDRELATIIRAVQLYASFKCFRTICLMLGTLLKRRLKKMLEMCHIGR